jgi:hypothetical protein
VRFVVVTVAVAAVIALIIVVANAVWRGQNWANAPLTDLASLPFQIAGALSSTTPPQPQPTAAQMALAAPEAPPSTQPAPTAARIEAVQPVQAAEVQMAQVSATEQKQAIEQERQTADRLVHAVPTLPSRTSPPSPPSAGEEKLLARAAALIGQGDIKGARLVLERAIEAGSARAVFALARTYDPLMLSSWNTYGIRGDLAKARDLYARAYAGGINEAEERMEALK